MLRSCGGYSDSFWETKFLCGYKGLWGEKGLYRERLRNKVTGKRGEVKLGGGGWKRHTC